MLLVTAAHTADISRRAAAAAAAFQVGVALCTPSARFAAVSGSFRSLMPFSLHVIQKAAALQINAASLHNRATIQAALAVARCLA